MKNASFWFCRKVIAELVGLVIEAMFYVVRRE